MPKANGLLALALALASVASAHGAIVLTIAPKYIESFDGAFRPLGVLDLQWDAYPTSSYHRIQFTMQIDGLAPGQDFANMGFSIDIPNGWTAADFGSGPYASVGVQFDINGVAPGGLTNHWSQNLDAGVAGDLQGILVLATNIVANSRQYGETPRPKTGSGDTLGYPTLFGEVYVQINYSTGSIYDPWPIKGQGTYLQIYQNNSTGTGTLLSINEPDVQFIGRPLFYFPEPASCGLAMIGVAGLLARRRVA